MFLTGCTIDTVESPCYDGLREGVENCLWKEEVMTPCRKKMFIAAVLLICACAAAPAFPAEPESKVVSSEWLRNNMNRADIRIVDVRNNVTDYWQGHVPGAVYMNPETMRLADRGVPVMLMPPEAMVMMLGKMGIDPNVTVVVYTEKGDFKASYLVWALDYLGHARAAVMEGGFAKWQKEGHPVTQVYPKIAAKKYPMPKKLVRDVRAFLEDVKKVVASGGAVILDVRTVDLYTGEKGAWIRKGHIKGSISRFWGEDLTAEGMWKDRAELKAAYEKLGATPDKQIITSCGQGQMSAHTYFTLKYVLGYPKVKNYDGSFNEWSNIPELPIETGMTP